LGQVNSQGRGGKTLFSFVLAWRVARSIRTGNPYGTGVIQVFQTLV